VILNCNNIKGPIIHAKVESSTRFLVNKTREAAGDKLARIKPLEKFFSRNLQRTNSLFSDILYSSPAGSSLPSKNLIL
jgi:hypothetical protein